MCALHRRLNMCTIHSLFNQLAHEVGGNNPFAAGIGVSLDDDVRIAELARELPDLLKRARNGIVVFLVEDRLIRFKRNHHRFGQNLPGAGFGTEFR